MFTLKDIQVALNLPQPPNKPAPVFVHEKEVEAFKRVGLVENKDFVVDRKIKELYGNIYNGLFYR